MARMLIRMKTHRGLVLEARPRADANGVFTLKGVTGQYHLPTKPGFVARLPATLYRFPCLMASYREGTPGPEAYDTAKPEGLSSVDFTNAYGTPVLGLLSRAIAEAQTVQKGKDALLYVTLGLLGLDTVLLGYLIWLVIHLR